MKNMFEEFEQLAREWVEFNAERGGSNIYEGFVKCYECWGGHNMVVFGFANCGVSVSFQQPVRFDGITHKTADDWEAMVSKGRAILEAEKVARGGETPEQARMDEVVALRKRLAELGEV